MKKNEIFSKIELDNLIGETLEEKVNIEYIKNKEKITECFSDIYNCTLDYKNLTRNITKSIIAQLGYDSMNISTDQILDIYSKYFDLIQKTAIKEHTKTNEYKRLSKLLGGDKKSLLLVLSLSRQISIDKKIARDTNTYLDVNNPISIKIEEYKIKLTRAIMKKDKKEKIEKVKEKTKKDLYKQLSMF